MKVFMKQTKAEALLIQGWCIIFFIHNSFWKREKLRRCIDVHEIRDLQNTAWNVKTQDTKWRLPCTHTRWSEDMLIPKILLSLNDYETDVENLGVPPNEMGVPELEADIALDITNYFLTDRRCSFLSIGSFAAQLREKGKLTEFYQAGCQNLFLTSVAHCHWLSFTVLLTYYGHYTLELLVIPLAWNIISMLEVSELQPTFRFDLNNLVMDSAKILSFLLLILHERWLQRLGCKLKVQQRLWLSSLTWTMKVHQRMTLNQMQMLPCYLTKSI